MNITSEDILKSYSGVDEVKNILPQKITILPLRDVVIFPNMIYPVLIGRDSSLKAIAEAAERYKYIFLTAQKKADINEPDFNDIYETGTIAKILQVLRLPNNLYKVLVEGITVGKIAETISNPNFLECIVEEVNIITEKDNKEIDAIIRRTGSLFTEYVKKSMFLPHDIILAFENIEDYSQKLYFAAANLRTTLENKQLLLNERYLKRQYFILAKILTEEIEMQNLENEINSKIQDSMAKVQKRYIIQEQIKTLQKELGDEQELPPDIKKIKDLVDSVGMPTEIHTKASEEIEKLLKMSPMAPDYSVSRNYVEWLAQVPWTKRTEDNYDINNVRNVLDEDHYGLVNPKDRIAEFIAILNMAGILKKQILCFCGPPGTGKTSLAKSIAKALGREYTRFSLGGVRDEAEIRGHRRTYIGALPGKIIQSMKKAGTVNPVILLDEIDKMSMDFRGDPSAALLEVLDPEQNSTFQDHYLEVEYDLSNVFFITTANVKYDIPLPLLDRMEIIELNSYLDYEKLEIAKRHIVPKIKVEFGLSDLNIIITDEAILKLIHEYTREAGVRNLERQISSIFRKLSTKIVKDYQSKSKAKKNKPLSNNAYFKKSIKNKIYKIEVDDIENYLKSARFKAKERELEDKIGSATGLAWTSVGGDTMPLEVSIMPGAEKLTLTGKLGDVMKESAMAALSYVRSNALALGVPLDFYKNKEIHIHVPEGAIPKDGPSAGITMTIALISAASKVPVRGDTAMTGEVTLRGKVLPIGGLKEKLLAAKRAGIQQVLIPKENNSDIQNMDKNITEGLNIILVDTIIDALPAVFHKHKTQPKILHTNE